VSIDEVGEEVVDLDADGRAVVAALDPGGSFILDDEGRVRLSFTRIDTLEQCPLRFRYTYVDRLPGLPAPQLSFGSSIHAALEWLYDRKHPVLPPVEDLLQALKERWDSEGYVDLPRDEQVTAYRHAQEVLTRFHARVAQAGFRLPVATEAFFELPVEGAVVVGSIDRLDADDDGHLHVVDYKTNKRAKPRQVVAESLQLAIYALACERLYGDVPATVTLDFVVPGRAVTVPIREVDLEGARERIARAIAVVRSGDDTPTPNRLCDWCDYRSLCPAWQGEGPDVLGHAVTELARLRRSLARDAQRLRALEAAVERLGSEADGQ